MHASVGLHIYRQINGGCNYKYSKVLLSSSLTFLPVFFKSKHIAVAITINCSPQTPSSKNESNS